MPENAVFKSAVSLIDDGSKVLHLTFGSRSVKPGEHVPKGEAQGVPKIGWNATSAQKFIIMCLDIDAPFPSFSPLSPALHWLQAGFAATPSGELISPDPVIAFWAGPGPPPISSPHRYIFLLYEQPVDFDAKLFNKASGFGIRDRMRWDASKFEKQAKLGPVVAATYFLSN